MAEGSWRERIAAARVRGRFMEADRLEAMWFSTCAWGEQIRRGIVLDAQVCDPSISTALHNRQMTLAVRFTAAVRSHDFDAAEDALDAIEALALQMKREGA
jgi:hypothetical protein